MGFSCGAAWREGVDDVSIGESIPVPMEMMRQIAGCFGGAGTDNEMNISLIEGFEVS